MQLSVNKTWQARRERWSGFPVLLGTNPSVDRPKSGGIRQDDNQLQLLTAAAWDCRPSRQTVNMDL
jgi:hypothetical protein